jgi:flagellar biosynthesis/type III secretory pathway chaperone
MNFTTAKIEQIIQLLENTEKLHLTLVPVIERERRVALGSVPQLLVDIAVEKEVVLAQLGQLERQRALILGQLAEDLNIAMPQLNLTILSEHADMNQKQRIARLKNILGKLVKDIKRKNEENRALIQHRLALTQNSLGFFQHWMIPASVYGSSGRINSSHSNGKLLSGSF